MWVNMFNLICLWRFPFIPVILLCQVEPQCPFVRNWTLFLLFVIVLKSYGVLTGYLLADDPQGETPLIPSEVMEYSIKHSTEVDINTTLQLLGSPGEKATSIPGCNRTDSVIRWRVLTVNVPVCHYSVKKIQVCWQSCYEFLSFQFFRQYYSEVFLFVLIFNTFKLILCTALYQDTPSLLVWHPHVKWKLYASGLIYQKYEKNMSSWL